MALPKGLPQVSDSGKLLGALNYDLVDDSGQRVATTATGSPAAGVFHSSIVGRKPIPDISKDLSVRYGIERIAVQQIAEVQDEFGPNGERVFRALNDDRGLIRFVGNIETGTLNQGVSPFLKVNEFVEITFYGTGLNILGFSFNQQRDASVLVNGVSYPTFVENTSSSSTILTGKNASLNVVRNAVSGLTLGLHTVKITCTTNFITIYGFEIIGPSATLAVQPGSAYIDANRVTLAAQQLPAYASGFTNVYGTAGTRGGRVLAYLASDGTVKKDIQYVDTAAAYLTSANHTNEEVIRTHYPREFGAGRTSPADDFSIVAPGGSTNLGFTLDDGTTTLVGQGVGFAGEGISVSANNGSLTITFVGTGLDVERFDDVTTAGPETQYTYSIDGVPQGSFGSTGSTTKRIQKIVSGLAYGTHTFRLSRGTPIYFTPRFGKFIVYGPKKPTLPSGAVELADYNLMGNYVAASGDATTLGGISSGVLFKTPARESVYVNTWNMPGIAPNFSSGMAVVSSAAIGNYFEYTFFGTGFDAYLACTTSSTATVQIDGVAYTGSAVVTNGGSWVSGTSTVTVPVAGGAGCQFQITGLSLGVHKVRITTSNAQQLYFYGISVITPIHSPKSNLYADLQNTLPIGSCAISDNRVTTTSVNTNSIKPKAWAQAYGTGTSPTYSTPAVGNPIYVPLPDMSCTIKTSGGPILVQFNGGFIINNAGAGPSSAIFINGVLVKPSVTPYAASTIAGSISSAYHIIPISAGVHKVDVYWASASGSVTMTAFSERSLTVIEL